MKKLGEILHIIFEKNGWIKLIASIVLGVLFLWLSEKTGVKVWKWIALPFGIYAGITICALFVFAWIINPIRDIIERRKKKNSAE
jgi:hypothetical protein